MMRIVLIWLLGISSVCTLRASGQDDKSSERRPNFVILLCDDLGYGDLECYGHPHIKTPHLNQLAEKGIRFTSFYSAAPVCSPSRVGLLTGRSPNRAGVYDWIPPAGKPRPDMRHMVHMQEEEITIAKLLQQSGYATCMSGKWHCNSRFNSSEQPQPGDMGFDHWFGTQNNASPSHANPRNFVRNGENVGPIKGYSCQIVMDEALSWLEDQQDAKSPAPFFLYIAFHEPHEPVASPKELVEKYKPVAENTKQAEYFANVENVDLAVGKLMAKLSKLNLTDDTFVIFTSDNGPETLNRYRNADRSYGRADPLRGMKLWTTEAGFRVAGIASWPKLIPAGQVSDQAVSSLDFLPTFCHLSGATIPADLQLDGINATPQFRGQKPVRNKPLVWAYYNSLNEHRVAMRWKNWKVLAKLNHGRLKKLSNLSEGNYESVASTSLTDFEIYDLSQDVQEKANIVGQSNERDSELIERLKTEYSRLLEGSHIWSDEK